MIDGFRIEVTADELIRLLDARIAVHEQTALDCEARRARLESPGAGMSDDEEDDDALEPVWRGYRLELERRAARARRRTAALAFLRDHIVAH